MVEGVVMSVWRVIVWGRGAMGWRSRDTRRAVPVDSLVLGVSE